MSAATPEALLAAVEAAVSEWRSSRLRRDETLAPLIDLGWRLLRTRLAATPARGGRWRLSDDDLRALGQDLDAAYGSVERKLAAKHTLNDLLYTLNQRGFVRSKYLNVPTRVPRRLVWTPEVEDTPLLGLLETLRDRVERDRLLGVPPDWPFSPALWRFVLLAMAMALSSYVLFPTLPRHLLATRRRDVAGGWLALPAVSQGGRPNGVKLRFPLTRLTRRHLHGLLASFPRRRGRPQAADLLIPENLRQEAARHFPRAWRLALPVLAPEGENHRRLGSFRQFTHTARWLALLADIPPFLVAVCSGELPVAPATTPSLRRCFGALPRPVPGPRRRRQRPRPESPPVDLFHAIETILGSVQRHATRAEVAQAAHALQSALGPSVPPAQELRFNIRCFGLWVCHLLRRAARRRITPGTVKTRASAITTGFAPAFGTKPFTAWDGSDWLRALQTRMAGHRTAAVRAAVRQFYDFLVDRHLTPRTQVAWAHPSLRKPPVIQPFPLITFEDFDRAFHLPTPRGVAPAIHDVLKAKMVLAFCLGLRSEAATRLRLADLAVEAGFTITIRRDKSRYGTRTIPGNQLLPPPYLDFLRAFYDRRLAEGGRGDAYLLATPDHPEAYTPRHLASSIEILLANVVPEPLAFHDLRHGFASWFLVRSLVAIGAVTLPPAHPFAQAPVFQPPTLDGLRELLFGFRVRTRGHETVPHYVVALAFLLGHSNPELTLTSYCHTAELILWLLQDPEERPASPGALPP